MSKEIEKTEEKVSKHHFKSRARLLPQLGDMLIKSEDVAFLELIKNSYDADAAMVNVLMENIDKPEEGIILIEDDGLGMDKEIIENVWLELGSDYKARKIEDRKTSPKGRIPIGEKGIGRLGAHKLGDKIELVSKREGKKEVSVSIDWRDFNNEEYLEDVIINVIQRDNPIHFTNQTHGTYIAISNLKTEWTQGKIRNIQRSITSITSPFEESNENFKPSLELLDKPGWLEGLITWEDIKDFSLFSFEIRIKGDYITYFNYEFKPFAVFEKASGRKIKLDINDDLKPELLTRDEKLVLSNKTLKRYSKDDSDRALSTDNIGEIIIKGEIFDFESFIIKDISDKSGLKKYVKSNSGVKVYRGDQDNGYVRVYDYGEPGNDWLGLNLRRVQAPVNLSNNLIVCGVFLDREQSLKLREKTNREGFIEDNFYEDFRDSVYHALTVVDTFRKADKKQLRDLYGPKSKQEPVHASINKLRDLVDEKIKDKGIKIAITSYIDDIESSYSTVYENLLKTASAGLGLGIVLHEIDKVIAELIHLIKDNKEHEVFAELVKRLSRLVKGYSEIFKKTNRANIELYKVIEDALFSVSFRLKAHNVIIEKPYLENKSLSSKIAKGLIEGVLINLIDNSIYWLEVAKEEHKSISKKKIIIDVDESDSFTSIIFADNGTGFLIPTDQAISPMETGKPSGGWGLGLHIANEIMLSHGGQLVFPMWADTNIPEVYKNGAILKLKFPKE
jgi:hypothetical protein